MPATTEHTLAGDADAVMRAARVITGIVAESVAHTGDAVTMPQLRALVLVATRPEVNVSAVAATLSIHPSNATRLCERMVQAGLLRRRDSRTDRRSIVLSLTAKGSELVDSVMSRRRAAFLRILAKMSADHRRALASALDEFAHLAGEPPEATRLYV